MNTTRPNSSPNTASPPSCSIATISAASMVRDIFEPTSINPFPRSEDCSSQLIMSTCCDAERLYLEIEEVDRLRVLLTFLIGTGRDLVNDKQLEEHVKKG